MTDRLSPDGIHYLRDLDDLSTWTGGRSDLSIASYGSGDVYAEIVAALPSLIRDSPTEVELREQLDTIRAAEMDSLADTLYAATSRLRVCGICERRPD